MRPATAATQNTGESQVQPNTNSLTSSPRCVRAPRPPGCAAPQSCAHHSACRPPSYPSCAHTHTRVACLQQHSRDRHAMIVRPRIMQGSPFLCSYSIKAYPHGLSAAAQMYRDLLRCVGAVELAQSTQQSDGTADSKLCKPGSATDPKACAPSLNHSWWSHWPKAQLMHAKTPADASSH